MKPTTIYQVDAFSTGVLTGNPAAVCPLSQWPEDELLQAIATENNLSETAFLVRAKNHYEIRWFTPRGEVDLCGHATLASAYIIFNKLDTGLNSVVFNSKGGKLQVHRKGTQLTLDFPALPYEEISLDSSIPELVNIKPSKILRSTYDLIWVMQNEGEVQEAHPNFQLISAQPYRGLIITSKGHSEDFYSRCFYPRHQVMEDPVTGSAHCVLTPYWSAQLGKQQLRARQGLERQGVIDCFFAKDRVLLTGQCSLYLEGTLFV